MIALAYSQHVLSMHCFMARDMCHVVCTYFHVYEKRGIIVTLFNISTPSILATPRSLLTTFVAHLLL